MSKISVHMGESKIAAILPIFTLKCESTTVIANARIVHPQY